MLRIRDEHLVVLLMLRIVYGCIAQWLERLTADQQVPGSTPGAPLLQLVASFLELHWLRFF